MHEDAQGCMRMYKDAQGCSLVGALPKVQGFRLKVINKNY